MMFVGVFGMHMCMLLAFSFFSSLHPTKLCQSVRYTTWYRRLKIKNPMGRNLLSRDPLKFNCQFPPDEDLASQLTEI